MVSVEDKDVVNEPYGTVQIWVTFARTFYTKQHKRDDVEKKKWA